MYPPCNPGVAEPKGSGQKTWRLDSALTPASRLEQVCVAREPWCHLSELWPLTCLGSFGDVGSFLAGFMNTKGNVGFHTLSKIASRGPGCRRSWVLSSVLEVKTRKNTAGAEAQLGDKNPRETLEAVAKP